MMNSEREIETGGQTTAPRKGLDPWLLHFERWT